MICIYLDLSRKGKYSLVANDSHLFMKKQFLALCLPLLLTACGQSSSQSGLLLLASFAPVYDYVRYIALDDAEIINIVGENEPHEFSPNDPKISAKAERCDALFTFGHHMDEWASSLNADKISPVTEGVNFVGEDPHAWLSLNEGKTMLKNVYDKLVALDPSHANQYKTNYESALERFDAANTSIASTLADQEGKTIVTSHEAFAYFCADYGLTQKGIADIADHEPSAKELQDIIALMKEKDIHVIYVEELDEVGYCETIKEELAKEGFSVTFATLDAHEGEDVSKFSTGGDLLSVLEENAKIIARN